MWLIRLCHVLLLAGWPLVAFAAPAPVMVLTLDGAVSPATADYVVRGIGQAADQGAALVVLKIDTPGGLDTSMRKIIKVILASPVPVATFVAPGGARAASAGTYILYASHVAAMAPATNLGAATPVQIGIGPQREPESEPDKGPGKGGAKRKGGAAKEPAKSEPAAKDALTRKQVHDASAYIRGLAQLRGRNAEWGERAVREAVSLSAEEARKLKVIDVIARDVSDLLRQLEGRRVTVEGKEHVLKLKDAAIVALEPDWRSQLLAVIADPNVALILMMVGLYGLIFEFSNPGYVLPGVAGAICVLLAMFAFQLLPINYAGLGLILLGIAFIVAEAFMPSFGALGIGGAIALVIGAVILVEPEAAAAGYNVVLPLVVGISLASAAVVFLIVAMAVKARGRPVVSGREELIGATGEVLDDFAREGWIRAHSENWWARSATPLARGQKVRVVAREGLTLSVEPEQPVEHRNNA
jgi:membrane-bound serine protease (ClpP class)